MPNGAWSLAPAAVLIKTAFVKCTACRPSLVHAFQCLAGIGKALAMRLADQGVNVVLVAKPDSLLDDTHAEMQSTYTNLQVRKASINQGHT